MQPLAGALLAALVAAAPAQRVVEAPQPVTPARQAQRLTRQLELPERCSAAWRGLVELGPPAAVPLAAATADPRPDVAMRAFFVLGLLGADGEAALPALRAHAAGKDQQLAGAAVWAIARIEFRGRLLTDYQTGKVEHLDAAGNVVRTIENLKGPWHAEPVGGGRLLVSEYGGGCVREIDAAGKEVWKRGDLSDPYHTQRLPGGTTIICDAGHDQVIEVDREGKVVWERKGLKRPVAAVRTPDGHTLIVEQRGDVFELDEQDAEIARWAVAQRAMRAERLLSGNTLIAVHVGNQVIELGPDGKEAATPIEVPQAQAALRRRDGHTLIAGTSCWIELDAAGKQVWRRKGTYAVGVYW
ncbi:MAG TPA: PQQ-binding-like beta-propeller repeat protein [Planctomycetota bacterium]|nr:PQQ-binding-like beta-propeller repeat protein [Planctomycetota bacterium]